MQFSGIHFKCIQIRFEIRFGGKAKTRKLEIGDLIIVVRVGQKT